MTQAANQTATTPYQTYQGTGTAVAPDYTAANAGSFVAPINSTQEGGIAGTDAAATEAQPYYGAATGVLGNTQASTTGVNTAAEIGTAESGAPLSGQDINQYLSPYLGDVLGSTEQIQNQENQQAQAGQLGDAISSGAFGGDRTGIAAANLQQQEDLANSNVVAGIANTGYQSALGTAQSEQGIGLTAAQQLAGIGSTAYGEGANTASELGALGTGAQTAGLTGAQAQLSAGTVEQQTQQAEDTAEYNQFLQQQSYPFQVDNFLAAISEGEGSLEGSTTTTQQPGGFFSDRRLKRDIKKIGQTYDHQDVVTYKMGDDNRTRIGLIAQDVEKKHPEAVGVAGGFKVVDYGKATQKAANQGHFNAGGVVPIRRKQYAYGGAPDGLAGVLQAQQQMYSGMAGGNSQRQINQAGGGGGGHSLAVANAPPVAPPQSGISQVNQGISTGNNAYKMYHNMTAPKSAPTTPTGVAPPSQNGMGWQSDPDIAGSVPPPDALDTSDLPAANLGDAAPAAAPDAAPAAAPAAASGVAPAAGEVAAPAAADAAAGTAGGALVAGGGEAAADYAAAAAADYAVADLGAYAVMAAKRGGKIRKKFDAGGMPYEYGEDSSGDLDIPDDPNGYTLKAAPAAGKIPTGFQTLMSMGQPDTASSVTGSLFSNEALARGGVAGGRRGYDDGGTPTIDDTSDGSAVSVPDSSPDVPVIDVYPPDRPAPSGVAAGSTAAPAGDTPWYRKPENMIPLLQAIGAMGTAKTVHPGVALAAGLGAGAQSYVGEQSALAEQGLAKAQTQQIATQTSIAAMRAKALSDYLSQPSGGVVPGQPAQQTPTPQLGAPQPAGAPQSAGGAGAPQVPPVPLSSAAIAYNLDKEYQDKYAVNPNPTPSEQAAIQKASKMQSLGLLQGDAAMEAAQKAVQWRVGTQQFQNQLGAQREADSLYAQATDPTADQTTRDAATARYNAVFQRTGDTIENDAGNLRNSRTKLPPIGAMAQTLTPQEQTSAAIARRGQDLSKLGIEKDENGNLFAVNSLTKQRFPIGGAGNAGAAPGAAPPTGAAAATAAPGSAPSVPRVRAAGAPVTPSNYLPGVNYDQVPRLTPQSGQFATKTGQVMPLGAEDERKNSLAESRAASEQDAKTGSIIAAAQKELKGIDPRTVGPGSDIYNGFMKFKTAVTGGAPDALVDQATLDKYLVMIGAQNVRGALSGQRITNQEMMTFMNRGSPSTSQPLQTIKNLVNYLDADTDYDSRLQNTKIKALEVPGSDPWLLPGYIQSQPGASRADYVQNKLGFNASFTPKQRPGQPGAQPTIVRTGTANGRKVAQYSDGSVAYVD